MEAVEAAIAAAGDGKEKLRAAFLELEILRGGPLRKLGWSQVEALLSEREAQVRRELEELRSKEEELDARCSLESARMDAREQAIAQREQRIQPPREEVRKKQDQDDVMEDVKDEGKAQLKAAEVRVRPYLKSLCEVMDGEGLRKYIVDHKKDMGALRNEMPSALGTASDPSRLVLSAIEKCYSEGDACGPSASASRRACILLLEALASVLGATSGVDSHPELKASARDLAEQWRSKLNIQDAPEGNSLDVQAFLQLLATFNLASEYDEEELCNLVLAVAKRKQSPALCKSLNLSHKIPEIVEQLANDAKQIEALAFAHAFDIMDLVQPVPLLKTYLKDARKTSSRNGEMGSNHPQTDTLSRELAALKSVLKCIDDYNLEVDYPPSPLQKRVAHLEKAKSERKRTGGSVKGQAKRPRNNSCYDRAAAYYSRSSSDRGFQQPQVFVAPQAAYDRSYSSFIGAPPPPPAAAAAAAAAAARMGSYLYSLEGPVYAYGSQSASFSSYALPHPPTYQSAYMH